MKKNNNSEISIIKSLVEHYNSMRAFSRYIAEDPADVCNWMKGKKKIQPRAIIKICRLHPEISPNSLNSEIFPEDLKFVFEEVKK